jgi:hypothetical protein
LGNVCIGFKRQQQQQSGQRGTPDQQQYLCSSSVQCNIGICVSVSHQHHLAVCSPVFPPIWQQQHLLRGWIMSILVPSSSSQDSKGHYISSSIFAAAVHKAPWVQKASWAHLSLSPNPLSQPHPFIALLLAF